MLGPKSQSDAVVARVRMFIAGTKSPAESAERDSRGSRRASGHVVIQPTFVNLPLVRTTTRPWHLGFESLIFVNLSLLPFSLNL